MIPVIILHNQCATLLVLYNELKQVIEPANKVSAVK